MEQAVGLAERLLDEHKDEISELKLIPGSKGEYEVMLDSEMVFSKRRKKRHPKEEEVEVVIRSQMRDKRY
ncbi:MAG: SelT/SelW/SelH family protein [Tindallia sp. MSAO_Bac2]|nr:MAG: SelT/SelW/SelH family protein [Tindallia sp. MSAO_Bac2]